MMTLMARLCALCAMNALMQMALPEAERHGGLHVIGGLLMLHMTLFGLRELGATLTAQTDLMRIFEILMQ